MEATPAEPDAWANSSAAILGAGDEQCAPINFSLKIDVNKPQFVVSSTVGIFTTIGNFLSIVILTKIICTRKESRNGSTFYLLALSTSDFLQALFVYPMLIKAQIGGVWSGGVASCNLMAFTGNFFQLLSAMIVSSLALIRFLATYKPFEFQMHLKRLRVWGAILALIFVVAAIVSAIPFTRYGCIALYPSSGVCSYNFQAGGARRISLVLILVLNELALLSIIVFTIGTIISLNAAARSST
ncbi:prostaglandin E2 receptor EP4 subtype-like, partial [Tubulanus polymorphus]|uniref:prostaglandin E2 receptor EP4 subtype-like n=1 Tax=Tubulanus polymorphus TaxID=672921 RepID=UPI003DA44911